MTILIFGTKLPKKGISDLKQKYRTFTCINGRYVLYVKLLRRGVGRHKGIIMSLLLLVTETQTTIEFREPEIQKVYFTFAKHATHGFEKLDHLCKCTEAIKNDISTWTHIVAEISI